MEDENIVQKHTILLTEAVERSKSNKERIDKFYELAESIFEMNKNTAVIAEQTRQQGIQMEKLVNTLEKQENRIDSIEHKMETKDTVAELEQRVEFMEMKDPKNAEETLKKLQWFLVATIISLILSGLANFIF